MVTGKLEANTIGGADFRTNSTFLAEHLQVGRFSINQPHDLRRAPLDAHAAAVAFESIDYWEHQIILGITTAIGFVPYRDAGALTKPSPTCSRRGSPH